MHPALLPLAPRPRPGRVQEGSEGGVRVESDRRSEEEMIIELFSGIGRSLGDEAIRIDFDPKTKPTICADVRFLPLRPGLKPDHVHGSPPCLYFTNLNHMFGALDLQGLAQSMRLVAAFFEAVDYLQATRWTLETPGDGFLARLLRERKITYKTGEMKRKRTSFYQSTRSLKNSVIPKEVMREVVQA